MSWTEQEVERACEAMHDAYEAAAVEAGWETQERSRKPWVDVPEANKATMRAAVRALAPFVAERERQAAAQALHDAAADALQDSRRCPEGCNTTACRDANLVTASWLRKRAGSVEAKP